MTCIWLYLVASQVQHFADDKETHAETEHKNRQVVKINMDIAGFGVLAFLFNLRNEFLVILISL